MSEKIIEDSPSNSAGYGKNWNPYQHYKNVETARNYDKERFANLPGRVFDALEKRTLRRAFRDVPGESTVVDVPCGTGRLAEALLGFGYTVTGVDISAEMLEVASEKLQRFGPRFSARVGDARELGNSGKQFDAALCARVLMHFPLNEQVEFLRGVAAATKGTVVFSHSLNTPYQRFRRAIKRLLGHRNPVSFPVSEDELKTLIADAGLREIARYRPMRLLTEGVFVVTRPA